jgi:hypothetical protein
MDRDALSALALAHVLDSLRFALGALAVAEVPEESTLRQLQDLADAREALELSTVTLLNYAGVSWEAMAEQLGVTRQSLNRRLGRKSTQLQSGFRGAVSRSVASEWEGLVALLDERVEELRRSGPSQISQHMADELHARRSRRHPSRA